jgi:2-oxo-4-hydroxy-4-carboxy-5-ureidoimidazoline decarboxylase
MFSESYKLTIPVLRGFHPLPSASIRFRLPDPRACPWPVLPYPGDPGGSVTLAAFNAAPEAEALALMLACCASARFAAAMIAGRPYPSADAAAARVDAAFATLTWDDVREAMDGHPRIGARVSGQSAAEQSGVADENRAALTAGNAAYEERFGHVFLICAAGLSGDQMLAALRRRMDNDERTERVVAAAELRKITVLRVRKALA